MLYTLNLYNITYQLNKDVISRTQKETAFLMEVKSF